MPKKFKLGSGCSSGCIKAKKSVKRRESTHGEKPFEKGEIQCEAGAIKVSHNKECVL